MYMYIYLSRALGADAKMHSYLLVEELLELLVLRWPAVLLSKVLFALPSACPSVRTARQAAIAMRRPAWEKGRALRRGAAARGWHRLRRSKRRESAVRTCGRSAAGARVHRVLLRRGGLATRAAAATTARATRRIAKTLARLSRRSNSAARRMLWRRPWTSDGACPGQPASRAPSLLGLWPRLRCRRLHTRASTRRRRPRTRTHTRHHRPRRLRWFSSASWILRSSWSRTRLTLQRKASPASGASSGSLRSSIRWCRRFPTTIKTS